MENKEKRERRIIINNWLSILALLLIVIGGGYIIYYQLANQIQSCTSNPINYAVQKISEDENLNFSHGAILLYTSKLDRFAYMVVPFNVTSKKEK